MEDLSRTGRIVRFGVYEIDRQACELRRSGQRIPLQIQPFRVLEVLIDHAGEVVTRAELRAKIWPSTVYVDFDHGLNNAMNRLRHALDDSADAPRFIETLPRIGYRFIHPLEQRAPRALLPATPRKPRRMVPAMAGGAALLIVGAIIVGVARFGPTGIAPEGGSVTASRSTMSAAAYDAYVRGVKLYEQRNKESVRLSIEHLERATELDPSFAAAHAALAMAYAVAGGSNSLVKYVSADQVREPALAAAERALALDPRLAAAHMALGAVLNALQPWSAATDVAIEQAYQRALELDPASANAHLAFGNFLSSRHRNDEALMQYRRAAELDPLSPSVNSRLGLQLVGLGMTGEGLEYLHKTVELDPWQFNAHMRLGWAYVAVDDLNAARMAFEAAERISPNSLRTQAGLAFVAARNGDTARARALLASVLPLAAALDDPLAVAIVYVGLKDKENSIDWLTKTARRTRALHMLGPWGIRTPLYDWLSDDPRFARIEREVTATTERGRPIERGQSDL